MKTFEQFNELDPYGEEQWEEYSFNIGDKIVANYMSHELGFTTGDIYIIEDKGKTNVWKYYEIDGKNNNIRNLLISEDEIHKYFIPLKFY